MQYADIIINHKAGLEPVTYAIPPAILGHLTKGSVVLVPYGRRDVHGVVYRFLRRLDPQIRPKLKSITRVIYPENFVALYQIVAAESLHARWGHGMGEILFRLIPPLPRRPRPAVLPKVTRPVGYRLEETIVSVSRRLGFYRALFRRLAARGQSLLIITHSIATAATAAKELMNLGLPVCLGPSSGNSVSRRQYFAQARERADAVIMIGPRSIVATPLDLVGAVAIDEPWFPGHKEDTSPRHWSVILAQALCQARKIPLFLATTVVWPDTAVLGAGRTRLIGVAAANRLTLVPSRSVAEVVGLFAASLRENRAIAVYEQRRVLHWCPNCRKQISGAETCLTCHRPGQVLTGTTRAAVQAIVPANIPVYTLAEIEQFRRFNAVLILGFDSLLAISDYRLPCYVRSVIATLRDQSRVCWLVTAQTDAWAHYLNVSPTEFDKTELAERRRYRLPPYGLPVRFTCSSRSPLEALKETIKTVAVRVGSVQLSHGRHCLSAILPREAVIPASWHRRGVTVDVLPHYVD